MTRYESFTAPSKAQKPDAISSPSNDYVGVFKSHDIQKLGRLILCTECGNVCARIAWSKLTTNLAESSIKIIGSRICHAGFCYERDGIRKGTRTSDA